MKQWNYGQLLGWCELSPAISCNGHLLCEQSSGGSCGRVRTEEPGLHGYLHQNVLFYYGATWRWHHAGIWSQADKRSWHGVLAGRLELPIVRFGLSGGQGAPYRGQLWPAPRTGPVQHPTTTEAGLPRVQGGRHHLPTNLQIWSWDQWLGQQWKEQTACLDRSNPLEGGESHSDCIQESHEPVGQWP